MIGVAPPRLPFARANTYTHTHTLRRWRACILIFTSARVGQRQRPDAPQGGYSFHRHLLPPDPSAALDQLLRGLHAGRALAPPPPPRPGSPHVCESGPGNSCPTTQKGEAHTGADADASVGGCERPECPRLTRRVKTSQICLLLFPQPQHEHQPPRHQDEQVTHYGTHGDDCAPHGGAVGKVRGTRTSMGATQQEIGKCNVRIDSVDDKVDGMESRIVELEE